MFAQSDALVVWGFERRSMTASWTSWKVPRFEVKKALSMSTNLREGDVVRPRLRRDLHIGEVAQRSAASH